MGKKLVLAIMILIIIVLAGGKIREIKFINYVSEIKIFKLQEIGDKEGNNEPKYILYKKIEDKHIRTLIMKALINAKEERYTPWHNSEPLYKIKIIFKSRKVLDLAVYIEDEKIVGLHGLDTLFRLSEKYSEEIAHILDFK